MSVQSALSHYRWWRWLLAVVLIAATWVSLRPMPGPQLFELQDKVLHIVGYTGFYLLASLAFPGPVLQWRLHAALLAYGALIEVLQELTPTRSMEAMDLLADAVGLGLGCLLLSLAPAAMRPVTARPDARCGLQKRGPC